MKTEYKIAHILIDGDIGIIVVKPPPLNQISDLFADEMYEIFNSLFSTDEIKAIVLTGTGCHFIAGMDISEIRKLRNKDICLARIKKIHKFVNAVELGPKPVIACINGHCTRGGLEIAIACHYRIAAKQVRLGMLDARFDLIPCMGGTQRLPRLMGVKTALAMITGAQDIDADQGKIQGLIDATADAKELLEKAKIKANQFISGRINYKMCLTSRRFDKLLSAGEKKDITELFKSRLSQTSGGCIAPLKAIEAFERGLGINFKSDINLESGLFCDCVLSDISKNLIDIFINTRNAGKITRIKGESVRKISKIGIIGSGTMGSGITALLLKCGYEIYLWDINQNSLKKGLNDLKNLFARSIKRGQISRAALEHLISSKIHLTTSFDRLKDADLIIESVIEDLETKQKIFKELEDICRTDTIFASTSSALPVSEIGSVLEEPGRLAGLHFFNPADKIQLLEINCSKITGDDILATIVDFAKKIRKIPFVTDEGHSSYVARQMFSIISEAFFLIAEGCNPFAIEKAFTEFGFPIGPARLSDLIGMDIINSVSRYFKSVMKNNWSMPPLFDLLYNTGCYGRKTRSGWYDYTTGTQSPNLKFMEVVKNYLKENNIAPKNISHKQILDQILARSINEGVRAVREGVSDNISDMDIAMVYGAGFPPHQGGPFKYADSWGILNIFNFLLKLEAEKGPRFMPSELLMNMAEAGKKFYKN
ncbi:Fatty acid oxidation complex subuint alpha [Desulfonema limicola]|uniref:Fatty acid oxidation complex subuint alpha n=1 Tax=Desulfonema limicola TaxID=45656 RepID=A0A975B5T0_9BACT|nr:3-hydroxyacyl-CoA dehydrogenase NAD-binding domain-containing protein [Desulfonema limicola]QTA79343.1 Fatty acid oxidation complex subuint alpha [Desulfonema limicola]